MQRDRQRDGCIIEAVQRSQQILLSNRELSLGPQDVHREPGAGFQLQAVYAEQFFGILIACWAAATWACASTTS